MFSKTLIVDYVVFSMQLFQTMSSLLDRLRIDFLCFQKCPQDTYINDKRLESALLYKHGAYKAGQEQQSLLT